MPYHDKTRRDQIGAELSLLNQRRADAASRVKASAEEEAKEKHTGGEKRRLGAAPLWFALSMSLSLSSSLLLLVCSPLDVSRTLRCCCCCCPMFFFFFSFLLPHTLFSGGAGSPSSLVTFYDAFTPRSGYVAIIMEYCSGGSLQV